jgi:hypothetical protein
MTVFHLHMELHIPHAQPELVSRPRLVDACGIRLCRAYRRPREAALHGVLMQIRNLSLPLVSVNRGETECLFRLT